MLTASSPSPACEIQPERRRDHLLSAGDGDDGEDKTADGVLSEEELPESVTVGTDAPLESDDWYNILYNNTGVPNHGHGE